MNLLDWLTIAAYIAINADMVLQIERIYHTKSSKDLSLLGMIVRYIAIIIVLFKFISLGSLPLIAGQILTALTFSAYFILAVRYFLNRK